MPTRAAQPSPAGGDVSTDHKRRALEQILRSTTLSRTEQLRSLLEYVCEKEIAGEGGSITEYSIGVEALGRREDFIPADDGIVRNRAHALRQKLLEYYTLEAPASDVRIDFPRGSYIPRFVLKLSVAPPHAEPAPQRKDVWLFWKGAAAGAAIVAGGFLLALFLSEHRNRVDPVLREAWGALAEPGANPLLVLSTPSHLILRPLPVGANVAFGRDLPAPPQLGNLYMGPAIGPDEQLHVAPSVASRWGQVVGLVAILKVLSQTGSPYQVLNDRAATLASMAGRNLMLFGDPTLEREVAHYLDRGVFTIQYDVAYRDFVVREKNALPGKERRTFYTGPHQPGAVGAYPGLLTVIPAGSADEALRRIVIFAGANSAGADAAAEFFSSVASMKALKERFRQEGIDGFPRSYQVVVEGRAEGQSLLSFTYKAHRVLDRNVR